MKDKPESEKSNTLEVCAMPKGPVTGQAHHTEGLRGSGVTGDEEDKQYAQVTYTCIFQTQRSKLWWQKGCWETGLILGNSNRKGGKLKMYLEVRI